MRRLSLLVGAIVLVDTMFYAAITPLLPDLVDELHLGKNGAGVLAGSYAAGTLIGALPGGWLAARVGVKATVLAGLTLMSVSGLAFAFGSSVVVVDLARFLQGVGGACSWAGGMAWVAGEAPRERRGEVIGGVLGAAIFGVQLGPVVGALATAIGREAAFSTTVLFGVALGAWAMTMPARGGSAVLTAPAAALRQRSMLAGMWLTALPAAAFGVLDVLAPLRLAALGASGLALGATFFAAAGVEAVIAPGRGGPPIAAARCPSRASGWPSARWRSSCCSCRAARGGWPSSSCSPPACSACCGCRPGCCSPPGAELIDLDDAYAYAFFNLAWAAGFTVGAAGGGALAQVTTDAVPYLLLAGAYAASLAVADRTPRYLVARGARSHR